MCERVLLEHFRYLTKSNSVTFHLVAILTICFDKTVLATCRRPWVNGQLKRVTIGYYQMHTLFIMHNSSTNMESVFRSTFNIIILFTRNKSVYFRVVWKKRLNTQKSLLSCPVIAGKQYLDYWFLLIYAIQKKKKREKDVIETQIEYFS